MYTHGCNIRAPIGFRQRRGGDLVVAGNHSWTKEGMTLKKAQLYRFDGKTGTLKWKWALQSDPADDHQLV